MLTITQGPANEFQILIFYGIVMFVFLAPIIIATAGLLGYLTRPTGPGTNTTQQDPQRLESPSLT